MDTMSISIAGMQAANLGVSVVANDLANANTKDFKAKRVAFEEERGGGVRASQITESGAEGTPGGSNVDPATEVGDLLVLTDMYKINAKVLEVQKEILGTVMDLKA